MATSLCWLRHVTPPVSTGRTLARKHGAHFAMGIFVRFTLMRSTTKCYRPRPSGKWMDPARSSCGINRLGDASEAGAEARTRSTMWRRSFKDRESRSSFQTTSVSPSGITKLRPVPAATGGLRLEDSLAASLVQRLLPGRQCPGREPWRHGRSRRAARPFSPRLRFVAAHCPKGLANDQIDHPVVMLGRVFWRKTLLRYFVAI